VMNRWVYEDCNEDDAFNLTFKIHLDFDGIGSQIGKMH
jgi:hypothetical protein